MKTRQFFAIALSVAQVVTLRADTFTVPSLATPTFNSALSACVDGRGDIINVLPGTYKLSVTVNKSRITIVGAGLSTKIVPVSHDPDCGGSPSPPYCGAIPISVMSGGDYTTIQNLLIDTNNPDVGTSVDGNTAILQHHISGLTLRDVTINGFYYRGVHIEGDGAATTASLERVTITGSNGFSLASGTPSSGVYVKNAAVTVKECDISTSTYGILGDSAGVNVIGTNLAGNGESINLVSPLAGSAMFGSRSVGATVLFRTSGGTPPVITNNWWGRNTGPIMTEIVGLSLASATPYLTLRNNVAPASVQTNGSATVTSELRWNSLNADVSGLGSLARAPISWTTNVGGCSVNPASDTTTTGGVALATFNAGGSPGSGQVTATVDGVAVPAAVTVTGMSAVWDWQKYQ